jgi:hypothetical protein
MKTAVTTGQARRSLERERESKGSRQPGACHGGISRHYQTIPGLWSNPAHGQMTHPHFWLDLPKKQNAGSEEVVRKQRQAQPMSNRAILRWSGGRRRL